VPRAAKTPKPDPSSIYVAWQSAAVGALPDAPVVQQGTRLRGDSEVVQAAPWLFVLDGTPESEWPTAHRHVAERMEAADTTPAHDVNVASLPWALEDREAVVLNRPLMVRDDTSGKVHEFAAGTRFDVSEPIVATLPNAFDAEKRGRRR